VLEATLGAGRQPELAAGVVAGRIAECLPPGPGLAGWLATAGARELEDGALAGVAASFRRLASWAQAGELAAVAQIASRAAARDQKIGVADDGRPARIPVSACAEVSLELVMSQCMASWWTDLGVTLQWRLAATGMALQEGLIDLRRAQLIAELTAVLGDDAARAVQDKILPRAGGLTTGQLRAALRRAVIAADPQGAERRRQDAERRAKVSLYGDEEGTATLSGSGLPAVQAAAAMSRITAMARALKAAGAGGGISLHRAQVFIGLLLGTLPFIPPAPGAPPDAPPPPDNGDPNERDARDRPDCTAPDDRSDSGPHDRGPHDRPDDSYPDDSCPDGGCPDGGCPDGGCPDDGCPGRDPADSRPDKGPEAPWQDIPFPGDQDAPRDDDGMYPDQGSVPCGQDEDDDISDLSVPAPEWPTLPAVIPPAFASPGSARAGSARTGMARPPAGLLDVALPWSVLAGLSAAPGYLGRIGPVTAVQARQVAEAGAADPAAQWRIIVTNSAGQALAVTRIPRRIRTRTRDPAGRRARPAPGTGLVGRVTLIISEDTLSISRHIRAGPPGSDPPDRNPPGSDPPDRNPPGSDPPDRNPPGSDPPDRNPPGSDPPGSHLPGRDPPGGIVAAALRAATRAAARAAEQARADAAAGGCAHQAQSLAYRPPPRLHQLVVARDLTCRSPYCGQPAWRGDLDHTIPWDNGGRTCSCNLGGVCRTHHLIKQLPGWTLTQRQPGIFEWTTPSGRTYTVTPDIHPL
jgi:hypothetical protein